MYVQKDVRKTPIMDTAKSFRREINAFVEVSLLYLLNKKVKLTGSLLRLSHF